MLELFQLLYHKKKERPYNLFLSKIKKNKSAIRGAQLVSIGIPTISLYNLVPNLMKILSKRFVKASHIF